ncbi:GrlR family regulatory protein [Bradyrhizobium sp. 137]|uniref:GrlR family regulatory protein n=1 Tax=Bradyrhizobium sp. 137 TaxID=2782614 RepID=UPI0031FE35CB
MLGGNSGFAHIGTYRFDGDSIAVDVTSRRHNFGADHQSLLGSDILTIAVTGRAVGEAFHFEGSSPQMPHAIFPSVMTPLEESDLAAPGLIGEGGILNGLYSIHLRILDGVRGGLTGVLLLNNGRILGAMLFSIISGLIPHLTAGGRARWSIRNIRQREVKTQSLADTRSELVFQGPAMRGAARLRAQHLRASAASGSKPNLD